MALAASTDDRLVWEARSCSTLRFGPTIEHSGWQRPLSGPLIVSRSLSSSMFVNEKAKQTPQVGLAFSSVSRWMALDLVTSVFPFRSTLRWIFRKKAQPLFANADGFVKKNHSCPPIEIPFTLGSHEKSRQCAASICVFCRIDLCQICQYDIQALMRL